MSRSSVWCVMSGFFKCLLTVRLNAVPLRAEWQSPVLRLAVVEWMLLIFCDKIVILFIRNKRSDYPQKKYLGKVRSKSNNSHLSVVKQCCLCQTGCQTSASAWKRASAFRHCLSAQASAGCFVAYQRTNSEAGFSCNFIQRLRLVAVAH